MIAILVLLHIVVITSLFFIWWGRFSVIPFFGLLWLVVSLGIDDTKDSFTLNDMQDFAQRHSMTIAWICMMLWTWWVVAARPDLVLDVLLTFVSTNIILRAWSHVRWYDIWRNMFQIWYICSLVIFLIHALWFVSWWVRWHLILICILLSTAVWWFFTFVLPALFSKTYRQDQYIFFILCNSLFLIWIYGRWRNDLSSAVVLAQMYLMILYCSIYAVYWYTWEKTLSMKTTNDDVIEDILAGKTILDKKGPVIYETLFQVRDFLLSLDIRTQNIIWFFNIIVVVFQVVIFAQWVWVENIWISEILLWFGIAAFFVNYLLLRTIGFGYHMQRVLSFLLVTGGIYLTIIHLFGDDNFARMSLGILWSLWSTIILWIIPSSSFWKILVLDDYKSRISSILIASIVNIIFLFQMWYHIQLTFSLVLLYIALQIFMILYARSTQIQKKIIY